MKPRVDPSITFERVEAALHRDNHGFCLGCGHEQHECEPDARRLQCEVCGEPLVYGAQELYFMLYDPV
jgi:predicted amidophosphoribosyltransferase